MAQQKPENDYIKATLHALNLQAVLGLVALLLIPYLVVFKVVDALVQDMYFMSNNYASFIFGEYQKAPGPESAHNLAGKYRNLIAYEGPDQGWYTDGTTLVTLQTGADRPYYAGLWERFELGPDETLVVVWPSDFFVPFTHIQVFLSWLGTPIVLLIFLYFMIRRSLLPLGWMQKGIQAIASGNLDYVAPLKGRGSKQILAQKFNEMTAAIRELIHSRDRLIMDLSHELRSPITRIKVALALMPRHEHKELVEKNIRNLEDIITTMLETQRINLQGIDLQRQSCQLAQLIGEAADLYAGRPPGLVCHLDETVTVAGDAGLLKLLLHNLLDNALKYSRADSAPVQVTLRRQQNAGKDLSVALLSIQDDGIGLDTDELKKVFEPFYKVAPERGFSSGYGLGLGLCKRIAEIHEGSIELANNPQGGLTVTVRLPIQAQASSA